MMHWYHFLSWFRWELLSAISSRYTSMRTQNKNIQSEKCESNLIVYYNKYKVIRYNSTTDGIKENLFTVASLFNLQACNKKRACPHLHVILCSCMRDEQKLREAHHPPRLKFWQVPLNNRTHFKKNEFRNVVAVLHHFSPLCVFVCFQKYRMDMLLTKMRMQTRLKNWVVFDWRKYRLRYKLKTAVANRDKDIDKFAVVASNRGNCVHILSIWNKVSVERVSRGKTSKYM